MTFGYGVGHIFTAPEPAQFNVGCLVHQLLSNKAHAHHRLDDYVQLTVWKYSRNNQQIK